MGLKLNGRQFNNGTYAYQTYKAYNVIDDIINFFKPQQAEAVGAFGFSNFKPTITQALKDLGKFEAKSGFEEGFRDVIADRDIPKSDCTGCPAGRVQERWPGYQDKCYCRKPGSWLEELTRMAEIAWESFWNGGQLVYAAKEYESNCVYYPKSSGYPKGRFCWRNKPCGKSSPIAICTNGGDCSSARSRWIYNYGCKKTLGKSSTKITNTGTGNTSCSTSLKQRCGNICVQKGGTPYLDSKCSCFCRNTSSAKPCPYSGCSSSKAGSMGCYRCRCTAICKKGNYPGVKSVKSDGTCYCNPKGGASGNVSKLTSGCSYSGCNSFTGMSRCQCRCAKICSKGGYPGVKSVSSSGGCTCKPKPKSTSSGGCSTYLKQRCGNICVQKGGRPYLDSKCSCFCRK